MHQQGFQNFAMCSIKVYSVLLCVAAVTGSLVQAGEGYLCNWTAPVGYSSKAALTLLQSSVPPRGFPSLAS